MPNFKKTVQTVKILVAEFTTNQNLFTSIQFARNVGQILRRLRSHLGSKQRLSSLIDRPNLKKIRKIIPKVKFYFFMCSQTHVKHQKFWYVVNTTTYHLALGKLLFISVY